MRRGGLYMATVGPTSGSLFSLLAALYSAARAAFTSGSGMTRPRIALTGDLRNANLGVLTPIQVVPRKGSGTSRLTLVPPYSPLG